MNKLYLIFVSILSIFIFLGSIKSGQYTSLIFLPIPAFFVSNLLTNSNEFSIKKHKRSVFLYFALIIILSLFSISKFI